MRTAHRNHNHNCVFMFSYLYLVFVNARSANVHFKQAFNFLHYYIPACYCGQDEEHDQRLFLNIWSILLFHLAAGYRKACFVKGLLCFSVRVQFTSAI